MAFQKAVKHEAKLRMSISGPAGSGKTWTALTLAQALGKNVALIDTEKKSASKYADEFFFDVNELDNFDPRTYIKAIQEAIELGYDVLIIDSLTHAWNGTGGLLDIVDSIARRKYSGNSFAAWKDATPIQNALIDALTSAPIHIIVTMRAKQEFFQEKNEKTNRLEVKRLGMAPIQRDGMEYEFDVVVDMDMDNTMIVQKSRCPSLSGQLIPKPDHKVVDILREWLRGAPLLDKISAQNPSGGTQDKAKQIDKLAVDVLRRAAERYVSGGWSAVRSHLIQKYDLGDCPDDALTTEHRQHAYELIEATAKASRQAATSGK